MTVQFDREVLSEYVDGRLDDEAKVAVAGFLREYPEDAEVVEHYRLQDQAIQAAFEPILREPIPERLLQTVRGRERQISGKFAFVRKRAAWFAASGVAACLFLGIGGAAGWVIRGQQEAETLNAFMIRQFMWTAADAYGLYAEDSPASADIRNAQIKTFVSQLYKRFGDDFTPPKLEAAGFEFAGGRLLPSARGPVAQLSYSDKNNRRLALFLVRGKTTGGIAPRSDFSLQKFDGLDAIFVQDEKRSIYFWEREPLKYALVSEMKREDLSVLVSDIVEQLTGRTN